MKSSIPHRITTAAFRPWFEQLRNLEKMWTLVGSHPQWQDKQTSMKMVGPNNDLAAMEKHILSTTQENGKKGQISFIYLMKDEDEMPLVVVNKDDNYTVLDAFKDEWAFTCQMEHANKPKTIGRILDDMSPVVRTFNLATHALVIGISGEDFITSKERLTQRRVRTYVRGQPPRSLPPREQKREELDDLEELKESDF
jgi:hypothetical protein